MPEEQLNGDHVIIDGVEHVPYPLGPCEGRGSIKVCDYRSRDCPEHERCSIGFDGHNTNRGEACLYGDRPSMCPIFTVSCVDCNRLHACEEERYYVALTLDVELAEVERESHPLYRDPFDP